MQFWLSKACESYPRYTVYRCDSALSRSITKEVRLWGRSNSYTPFAFQSFKADTSQIAFGFVCLHLILNLDVMTTAPTIQPIRHTESILASAITLRASVTALSPPKHPFTTLPLHRRNLMGYD